MAATATRPERLDISEFAWSHLYKLAGHFAHGLLTRSDLETEIMLVLHEDGIDLAAAEIEAAHLADILKF